jgi:hypothetical protein
MTTMMRCLECHLVKPSTASAVCMDCDPDQTWDESDDFPASQVMSALFPSKDASEILPLGEDGQPIRGTYILCRGRVNVNDNPRECPDWTEGEKATLGPLFQGA